MIRLGNGARAAVAGPRRLRLHQNGTSCVQILTRRLRLIFCRRPGGGRGRRTATGASLLVLIGALPANILIR